MILERGITLPTRRAGAAAEIDQDCHDDGHGCDAGDYTSGDCPCIL